MEATSHSMALFNARCMNGVVGTIAAVRGRSEATIADEKVAQFDAWLDAMGHKKCNLQLRRFPRGSTTSGYGMIAGPGGVQKGQVIVNVPIQAFMSEETALNCPHVGPLIKKADMTSWQMLCLHLLYEQARALTSLWHPYIMLLPTKLEMAGLHPLLLPEGLCREWLAGSPMLSKVEARVNQCREDLEVMLAAGASQLEPAGSGSGAVVTEAAVRWAAAILLSRAFSLALKDQMIKLGTDSGHSIVLVPWADMLNHNSMAGKNSCLKYDSKTKVASLSAHISYKEGQQVFDSYGPNLCASQLFVDYGFVDEENKNHAIDLPATILGPTRGNANEALLSAIGLPIGEAIFSITDSGVDKSVLAWTRVAVASQQELQESGWIESTLSNVWIFNRAASAMAHFDQPVSHKNEAEVLRRLLRACEVLLTQYPTSLEEDLALLTSCDKNENKRVQPFAWTRKQALRAIISEKLALQGGWKHIWILWKRLCNGVQITTLHRNSKH